VEDWVKNIKTTTQTFRYFYNAEGIAGIRYNNMNFNFLRDGLGNVSKVLYHNKLLAEYNYDAWGNCRVIPRGWQTTGHESDEFVMRNNPFRWKGYYCDLDPITSPLSPQLTIMQRGLYYIHGSYYDPILMQFLDALDPDLLSPASINGLDRYGLRSCEPLVISSKLC
jgi:hypothetical protein